MKETETVETTLGDLIVVLTEETTRFVHDEKEAYLLVAFILKHLLYNGVTSDQTWH
jgi:hypothetical protein